MAVSLFLHYTGEANDPGDFLESYRAGPGASLARIAGATSVELLTPVQVDDPLIDDGEGPVLVAQVRFPRLFAAEAALRSSALADALAGFQGLDVAGWHLTYEILSGEPVATAGETEPNTTAVPVSYLVHYERPADDEVQFIEQYCERRPPIMAALPGIRRCEVFTPLAWTDALPVERADHMLISDAGFESAEALSGALRSEARTRLRDDIHELPPFDGRVTRFGMRRTRLLP